MDAGADTQPLEGRGRWAEDERTNSPSVDVSGLSHPGKVRSENEDHFFVARFGRYLETLQTSLPPGELPQHTDDAGYALVVADGMGGHAAGELASRIAIRELVKAALALPDWIIADRRADPGRGGRALGARHPRRQRRRDRAGAGGPGAARHGQHAHRRAERGPRPADRARRRLARLPAARGAPASADARPHLRADARGHAEDHAGGSRGLHRAPRPDQRRRWAQRRRAGGHRADSGWPTAIGCCSAATASRTA